GLSRAHRGRQAEDSRPQLCAPLRLVWRTCGAWRRLSPGAQDLRVAHPRLAQEVDGVSRLRCGQHLAGAKGVRGDGSSPESYALRLGAKGVDKRDQADSPVSATVTTSFVARDTLTPQQSHRRLTRRTNGFSTDLTWCEHHLWLSLASDHVVVPHKSW